MFFVWPPTRVQEGHELNHLVWRISYDFMLHVRAPMLSAPSFPSQELSRVIQEHGMDMYGQRSLHSACVQKNRRLQCCPKSVPNSATQPRKPFKNPTTHRTFTTSYAFLRSFLSLITCQLQHRSSQSVAKFHSLQGDWSIATASNFIMQKLSCATSYALSTSGFNL